MTVDREGNYKCAYRALGHLQPDFNRGDGGLQAQGASLVVSEEEAPRQGGAS